MSIINFKKTNLKEVKCEVELSPKYFEQVKEGNISFFVTNHKYCFFKNIKKIGERVIYKPESFHLNKGDKIFLKSGNVGFCVTIIDTNSLSYFTGLSTAHLDGYFCVSFKK